MRLILFFCALVGLAVVAEAQQLVESSILPSTLFVRNPAMTGTWAEIDAYALYRQSWAGVERAPRMIAAGIQYPITDLNMAVGGELLQDRVGPLRQTGITAAYSYQLKLDHHQRLNLGLMVQFSQFRFDGSDEVVSQPGDPLLFREGGNNFHFNTGLGVYYIAASPDDFDRSHFFGGFSVFQAVPSDLWFFGDGEGGNSNFRRVLHGFAQAGYRFALDYAFIQPSVQVDFSVKNLFLTRLNILFEMDQAFWAGLSMSSNFEMGLQAGTIMSAGDFGSLRVGALGFFPLSSTGKLLGLSYGAFVGYQVELD